MLGLKASKMHRSVYNYEVQVKKGGPLSEMAASRPFFIGQVWFPECNGLKTQDGWGVFPYRGQSTGATVLCVNYSRRGIFCDGT